ncbi:MAG TPA: hypothetical protein VFK84_19070 [Burkholderiales bacterium]|nr:hypothetical protein [Burkholderiales bacterium]
MRLMLILWPSFVAAGVAEMVFFNIFDPSDFDAGRLAAYSIGFFLFWSLAAMSSALTCFLQRSRDEVNRCPLEPVDRPRGCPKRPA